jgi:hypothetical protein
MGLVEIGALRGRCVFVLEMVLWDWMVGGWGVGDGGCDVKYAGGEDGRGILGKLLGRARIKYYYNNTKVTV